jgi:hypothetical protein
MLGNENRHLNPRSGAGFEYIEFTGNVWAHSRNALQTQLGTPLLRFASYCYKMWYCVIVAGEIILIMLDLNTAGRDCQWQRGEKTKSKGTAGFVTQFTALENGLQ